MYVQTTSATQVNPAQAASLYGSATALGAKGKTLQQVQKSAQDFESVFATEMLTPMFDTVKVDETFGGGHGEEMFRTMLTEQYGKQIAQNDSLGVVHSITDALVKIQEGKR